MVGQMVKNLYVPPVGFYRSNSTRLSLVLWGQLAVLEPFIIKIFQYKILPNNVSFVINYCRGSQSHHHLLESE